jgi:hypothetical protein
VLDRWRVTAAVVSTSTRCATLLRESPEWRTAYADERNLVLTRRE